jgi:mRNA interferase RelE/StbE
MVEYGILFARSARKELERLEPTLGLRVLARIESLSVTPRPDGCRKFQGSEELWRIRIGDYRVVYSIDDHEKNVDVIAIRHRKEVYR